MVAPKLKQVVVVLVDDEPGVRSAMKMLLEAFGYAVEAYATADDALTSRFCRPKNGDELGIQSSIIVSDVRMPGMDGFDFLTTIRRAGVKTPFVLVSGHASKDELARGLSLGAQGFLSKPYDPMDLKSLIEDLTEKNPETNQVRTASAFS